MSTKVLADVLLKMLTNEKFAAHVIADPPNALKPYTEKLTDTEFKALATAVAPKDVPPIHTTPYVGAWKLLAQNIHEVDKNTKDKLNTALSKRAAAKNSIPCTGS